MPIPAESIPGAVGIPQAMSNPGTSASSTMQQRSSVRVLQQLLTSLKSSNFPERKRQVLHLLKSNPQLMAAFVKQRSGQPPVQQLQRQQQQQIVIRQSLPRQGVRQQRQQQQQLVLQQKALSQQRQQQLLVLQQMSQAQPIGLRPQSQMMGTSNMPIPAGAVGIPQGMSNPGTSASSTMQQRSNVKVLQQLLAALKSSNFPGQKQQVIHILKSNPHLMAAFIKQRSGQPPIQQLQQHQQQQTVIGQSLLQQGVWKQRQQQQLLLVMQQMSQAQSMGLRPQSQMLGVNNMPIPAGSVPGAVGIPQGMSNPGTSASSTMQQRSNAKVLQQLLTNSPGQVRQVMHLLKSNPQLMAEFIKQRSGQAPVQQPQQQAVIGQPLLQPRVWQQQQQLLVIQQRQQMQPNQSANPGTSAASENADAGELGPPTEISGRQLPVPTATTAATHVQPANEAYDLSNQSSC